MPGIGKGDVLTVYSTGSTDICHRYAGGYGDLMFVRSSIVRHQMIKLCRKQQCVGTVRCIHRQIGKVVKTVIQHGRGIFIILGTIGAQADTDQGAVILGSIGDQRV